MHYGSEDLIKLSRSQLKQASKVCKRAFTNDPLIQWLFAQEDKKDSLIESFFACRIRYGLLFGQVFITSPKIEGIAVWYSSKYAKVTNWRMIRARYIFLIPRVKIKTTKRIMSFSDFAYKQHHNCVQFPHVILAPIAVDPSYQGKGWASKLIRPVLAKLDETNTPCFLQTQSELNVKIYEHYGFEIVDAKKIPGSEIITWAMLRQPNNA